jgi:transposase
MNGDSFEKWFKNILPQLEENSVIVLDNASYHSRKLEKVPTSASRKVDVQNWLRSKDIEFDQKMLKYQLLDLVKPHRVKYNKYVVDEMAKSQNKIVLRLPPYHCELNPIELIWADAKNFVAKHNRTYKLPDVKILFSQALENITTEKWQKCIAHVREKVETKMWELDNIMEIQVERLVIHVSENEDTTSNNSDSDLSE